MDKILKQVGICIIILLSVLLLQGLNIPLVDKGLKACSVEISKDYSVRDIMTFGGKTIETIKGVSAVAVNAVVSAGYNNKYGEPIDEVSLGEVSSVYAVSGGTVISIGENEALGKYVKIAHGKDSESIYGHCSEVYVQALQRVKKGQIIAEYDNQSEETFYYELAELK